VIPDKTGLIVKAGDEASLFQAMESLLSAPVALKEMGNEARLYMEGRSYESAFDETWRIYQKDAVASAPNRWTQRSGSKTQDCGPRDGRQSNMRELRIQSWSALQEELYRDSWNGEIGRFRSRYAFRGLSDAGLDLRRR